MTRALAMVGFGGFLLVATTAMDLIGTVLIVGLILTVGLGAGMIYAVRTTETGVRPSKWWTRADQRTVADEAPVEVAT